MVWARVDDSMIDHPKFLGLSLDAIGLWTKALAYCGRHLTDGRIPRAALPLLAAVGMHRALALAAKLVASGLWEAVGADFVVHDFTDWNPSADEVRARRAATLARVNTYRDRRSGRFGNAVTDHARNAVTNGVGNVVTHASVTSAPTRPDPETPLTPLVTISQSGAVEYPIEAASWFHDDGCPKSEYLERVPEDHRRQCREHRAQRPPESALRVPA